MESLNAAPASTLNQLSGYCHDAAGNLVLNSACPSGSFTPTYYYDAENQLYNPAATYTYWYDADGVRARKAASATVGTMYWPGPGGEFLMETNGSGTISEEYIYFDGERIARVDHPSGTVHYYFSDELGSTSTITDPTGTVVQERCYYFPYGGTTSCTGSDPNHYKFTGKERDTESGNDYFGARYYPSNIGRFMSPDPLRGTLADPQTLNLYAYVRNNPTNLTDPTGMQCTPGPSGQCVGETQPQDKETSPAVPLPARNTAAAALLNAMFPPSENFFYIGGTDANFNHISYDVGSGNITQTTTVEGDLPDVKTLGSGYSGKGAGLNNPSQEDVPGAKGKADAGPIPEGKYTIGKQQTNVTGSGTQLPASMRLTPDAGNEMYGRGGFLIHGDNAAGNHSASEGCIIADKATRDAIANTGYSILWVLP